MKHWLINKLSHDLNRRFMLHSVNRVRSKIPTWVLKYLVKRNMRLRQAGHLPDKWYWADLELFRRDITLCPDCYSQKDFAEQCPFCYPYPQNPVGISEWIGKEHKSYGESND